MTAAGTAPSALARWPGAVLVVGLTTLAFANTFGNGWHYDDLHAITENEHLRSLADPLRFLTDPSQFSRDADKAMYRPLLLLTFALNFAWSGLSTYSYHIVNLGLHAGASALVWRILLALGRRPATALFGGLLFGLHPIACEPVNYVSSRSELLGAIFVLASFHAHQRTGQGAGLWAGPGAPVARAASVLLFALGLLSKEMAIVTPALLVLHDALSGRGRRLSSWRGWTPYAPYAAVAFAFLAIELSHLSHAVVTAPVRGPAAQLSTQIRAAPHYAKLLAFPIGFSVHHQFFASGAPLVIFLAASALASVAAAATLGPRRDLLLGLGWMAIAMSPTAIVPLHVLVNDHRLYLPLAGAAIALTAIAPRRRRSLSAGIALGLLAALAATTWQRNRVWQDEYTLWSDAAAKSPHPLVPVAYIHLGNYAKDHGALDEAIAYFQRALQIAPGHVAARNNLATALQQRGRLDEAIAMLEGVVAEEPGVDEGWYNLGKAYQQGADEHRARGQGEEALRLYARAGEAYRRVSGESYHHDLALNMLGTTFEFSDRLDSAARYYRLALERRADSPQAAANVARLLRELPARGPALIEAGRHLELEALCGELLRVKPDDRDALFLLAASRFNQRRYRDSLAPNLELVARHPLYEEAYLQLANAYETLGEPGRAAEVYRQQLDRAPSGPLAAVARQRLERLQRSGAAR